MSTPATSPSRATALGPARLRRLEVAVGPERRHHPRRPGRVRGQRGVRRQVVARVVGGGQHRDAEPLEQGPGPVGRLGQAVGDLVVDRVGGRRRRPRRRPRRCRPARPPASTAPACRGTRPSARTAAATAVAGRRLGQRPCADAELVQRDAAGVQQPGHVVVGRDEQRRRVGERLVVEQQARVDVPVRGDRSAGRAPPRTAGGRSPRTPGSAGSSRSGCSVERRQAAVTTVCWRCRPVACRLCPAHRPERACQRLEATMTRPGRATATRRGQIGGADQVLTDDEVRAFVADQLGARRPGRPQRLRARPGRHPQLPAAAAAGGGARRAARPGQPADRAGRAGHARGRWSEAAPRRAPGLPGRAPGRPLSRDDRAATTSGGTRPRSPPSARSAPTGSPSCPTAGCARPVDVRLNRAVVEHDVALDRRPGVPARGGRLLRRQQVPLPRRLRPGGHRPLALARRADHQRRASSAPAGSPRCGR